MTDQLTGRGWETDADARDVESWKDADDLDMPAAEMEVRGLLDEARIHLEDAIDALRRASRESRDNDGPYWLHGQLDVYTIPHLESWIDGGTYHQTGSIGGLLRELDGEND